jgi:hypothetical protein
MHNFTFRQTASQLRANYNMGDGSCDDHWLGWSIGSSGTIMGVGLKTG